MGNISLVLCDEGCVGVEGVGVGVGGRLKREGMYVYLTADSCCYNIVTT